MTILGGPSGFGPRGNDSNDTRVAEIPTLTEQDFEPRVLRSEIPVLVEFTTLKAGKLTQAEVSAFMQEVQGKVAVYRVEAERAPMLVRQLRIQQVPTFMLFADQKVADAQAGPLRKKDLLTMVDPYLPRPAGALKAPEVAALLTKGLVAVVDTRDAPAFGRARLPKATHIPYEQVAERLAELYMLQGQPVLYCRSGEKTKELVATLHAQGVELGYLEGGMLAWEAESLPIER
jgi:thioredoxin-like negative regulator of GroEL